MQPEDSSLVRRSPFSIYDLLPILTFLVLRSVIRLGLATAASLFHRHNHRSGEILMLAAWLEHKSPLRSNVALASGVGTESRFIRSGSVSGWRNRLGAEQIEIMERTSGPLLGHLGYAVDGAREENLALASLPRAVGQQ